MNKSKRIKNILFWRTYCLFNFLDNLNNIKFKYSDILKIWIEYDRLIYSFIKNWFFYDILYNILFIKSIFLDLIFITWLNIYVTQYRVKIIKRYLRKILPKKLFWQYFKEYLKLNYFEILFHLVILILLLIF